MCNLVGTHSSRDKRSVMMHVIIIVLLARLYEVQGELL